MVIFGKLIDILVWGNTKLKKKSVYTSIPILYTLDATSEINAFTLPKCL